MLRKRTFNYENKPLRNYITATYDGQNISLLGARCIMSNIKTIIADGIDIGVVNTYNFPTASTHIVKIVMNDNVTNCEKMFEQCPNLKNVDFKNFDMSKITNLSAMFYKDEGLINLKFEGLDWKNVTTMNSFCSECAKLRTISFININSPKLTNLDWAFNWTSLESCDLSGLDLSAVTSMASMFKNCWYLTSLKIMSPISALTNITEMFYIVWTTGNFYHNKNYDYSKLKLPRQWTSIAI